MEFEVNNTDLLGRTGKISIRGKNLETPYLFPVIHPIRQELDVSKIRNLGFNGIMTNSYILFKNAKEECIEKGLHSFLGFDGIVMTDSGGYQVLRYASIEVQPVEIASFQESIGSDLAVTLDVPTGNSSSYLRAKETVGKSLKGAIETILNFSSSKTTWVGPIQGGRFKGLLEYSTMKLLEAGFSFLALGSPTQVMENYDFVRLARMIIIAKRKIPDSVPLHLFGAGHPLTFCLAVALGCDTFDSASYILYAKQGRYMTEGVVQKIEDLEYLPCSCEICAKRTVSEFRELDQKQRVIELATHNLIMLRKELTRVKQAIKEGRLWDLLREKASLHPNLWSAFLHVAKNSKILEEGTPVVKKKGVFIRDEIDLLRPEVTIARKMLGRSLKRRLSKAIVFSEGYLNPSSLAKLTKDYDIFIINPCFGIYPYELRYIYPFTQTVISEASHFGFDVGSEVQKLFKIGYKEVRYREQKRKYKIFKNKSD